MVWRIVIGGIMFFVIGAVFVFWGSAKLDEAARLANHLSSPLFSFQGTFLSPIMSTEISADKVSSVSDSKEGHILQPSDQPEQASKSH